MTVVRNIFERGRTPLDSHRVPAPVRDLQVLESSILTIESYYASFDDVQALMHPELFALGEQKLESQADAEKRFAGADALVHRFDKPVLLQVPHAIRKGADAGQDHPPGAQDRFRLPRDHGLVAHALKAFLNAPQISHSIIDDRNHDRFKPSQEKGWRGAKWRNDG